MEEYRDLLFENYDLFIKEHSNTLSTPTGIIKLISDVGMFRSYCDALCEGLTPAVKSSVMGVLNRQREMLLTEAANVPGTTLSLGWTVVGFPILVDIYREPVVSKLCSVFPVSSPIISVPRIKIMAQVKELDGTTTESRIPVSWNAVRPSALSLTVTAGQTNNIFTLASAATGATITADKFRINRRYTLVNRVTVTETIGANQHTHNVDVIIRPDNRGQFIGSFSFTSQATGNPVIPCTLNGNIAYDTGVMLFNVTPVPPQGYNGSLTYTARLVVRFSTITSDLGRIKVKLQTEMTDITIDPNEDFMIELPPEDISDYKNIFKVDVLRDLAEAVKAQILLNLDGDLGYFLSAAETEMGAYGNTETLNLTTYEAGSGSKFSPEFVLHVFASVIPKIAYVMGKIKKSYGLYPNYIVTGAKTAALLRSLQKFALSMPGIGQTGSLGWTSDAAMFTKLDDVLESYAVGDNKIYLAVRSPDDRPERAVIGKFVHQPLYVVSEITDGNTRNYIRSRTLIEILRPDGVGVITVSGLSTYFA